MDHKLSQLTSHLIEIRTTAQAPAEPQVQAA
jgi:hypothetical protein